MEGIDQGLITIGNDISANFAGTCQFPVIRIQLLMKDEKTEDLGTSEFIVPSQVDIPLNSATFWKVLAIP